MARNWAILIGANEYEYPAALPPLRYAQRDARQLRAFLRGRAGFERTFLFTPDASEERFRPTRSRVRRLLQELAGRSELRSGDNLWFFFSGHGQRGDEGGDYLMLPESHPADVAETGLAVAWVAQTLRQCGADNVVLFLDACRDQARQGGKGAATGTGDSAAALGREQCLITVSSCSPHEASYELEALGHGAFTYSLLEALDAQNRCGTVEKIDRHLRRRVPDLVRTHKDPRIEQNPRTVADPLHKQHLILVPDYATAADLAILERDAFDAEFIQEELGLALQLWRRVLIASRGQKHDEYYAARRRIEAKRESPQRQPQQQPTDAAPVPPIPSQGKGTQAAPGLPVEAKSLGELALQSFSFEVVTLSRQGLVEKMVKLGSWGLVVSRTTREARYFAEDLGNGIVLEMVQIPGGTFTMGSPESEPQRRDSEGPQREVTVPGFFLGKFAVTQAQWRRVAALPAVNRNLDTDPSEFKGDNRPVQRVSWDDAQEFCRRLSRATGRQYRLPSEAEWEYACRAGTQTPFHLGEILTTAVANYDGNYSYHGSPKGEYRGQTTEVGQFPANAWGLYDMHGNVWECCEDDWHSSYKGAPTDGSAWVKENRTETGKSGDDAQAEESSTEPKLLRGGSWFYAPRRCRAAYRLSYSRDRRNLGCGFRVVCVAPSAL